MPETDIVNTRSDSSTHQVQNPELEVLPPQANEVVEVVPYPVDTVAVWRPKRIEKIDTFYISAYDFPATVMDTTYLDSCLAYERVAAPDQLVPPEHIPVSAEELAYDSIFAKLTSVSDTTIVRAEQVTVSAKDQYVGFEGIPKVECIQNQFWFAPLLFAIFFCYGLVFALRSKSVARDAKEFFSLKRHSSASAEFSNEQKVQYRFVLNVLAMVNISVFVVLALHSYMPKLGPRSYLMAVLACFALSAAYVLFKQFTAVYLAFVFFDKYVRREWSHSFLYLWGALGMVLFPVILCLSFGPVNVTQTLLYVGVGAACLAELLLIVYDIVRFFRFRFSILYLILYLCTLEFLPLAALLFGYYNSIATV